LAVRVWSLAGQALAGSVGYKTQPVSPDGMPVAQARAGFGVELKYEDKAKVVAARAFPN